MPSLDKALDDAVDAKILNRAQRASLGSFLAERGLSVSNGTDRSIDTVTDTEAPRFLRGFHDILITIGILAAITGIWAIGNSLAVLASIWILAEIFVKRQRLALPAFTLTLVFVSAVSSTYITFVVPYLGQLITMNAAPDPVSGKPGNYIDVYSFVSTYVFGFLFLLGSLIPFYWRFRVPVSLACLILGFGGCIFTAMLWAVDLAAGPENFFEQYAVLTTMVAFAYALSVFAVAMRLDLSDRARTTRRSDVAFWLHLCAAPMLLASAILLVMALGYANSGQTSISDYPNVIIAMVIVLMVIGIVIDRRAFVTAGLISLGTAITTLVSEFGGEIEDYSGLTILIIGLIVLSLGSNWQRIRRMIVGRFPDRLQARLPPVV